MAAPIGNKYWQLADPKNLGRPPKYNPQSLIKKAYKYFEWIEATPIVTQQNLGTKNVNVVEFKRPFTIRGFCLFANISMETYYEYKRNKDFFDIIHKIDDMIYNQKFEGAAIGIFKENIIARDLGLKDKQDTNLNITNEIPFNIPINKNESK